MGLFFFFNFNEIVFLKVFNSFANLNYDISSIWFYILLYHYFVINVLFLVCCIIFVFMFSIFVILILRLHIEWPLYLQQQK